MKLLITPNQIEEQMCALINKYQHYHIASAWASIGSNPFDLLSSHKIEFQKWL